MVWWATANEICLISLFSTFVDHERPRWKFITAIRNHMAATVLQHWTSRSAYRSLFQSFSKDIPINIITTNYKKKKLCWAIVGPRARLLQLQSYFCFKKEPEKQKQQGFSLALRHSSISHLADQLWCRACESLTHQYQPGLRNINTTTEWERNSEWERNRCFH